MHIGNIYALPTLLMENKSDIRLQCSHGQPLEPDHDGAATASRPEGRAMGFVHFFSRSRSPLSGRRRNPIINTVTPTLIVLDIRRHLEQSTLIENHPPPSRRLITPIILVATKLRGPRAGRSPCRGPHGARPKCLAGSAWHVRTLLSVSSSLLRS